MNEVAKYKRHAAECRLMAKRASSADIRATLEEMAKTWDQMAKDREQQTLRATGKSRPN